MTLACRLLLGMVLACASAASAAADPVEVSPQLLVGQWACGAATADPSAPARPTLITFRDDGTGSSQRTMDLEQVAAVEAGKVALVTSFTWQAAAGSVLLTQGRVDAEPGDDSVASMISAIALRKELDGVAQQATPSHLAVLRLDQGQLVFDSPKAQRSRLTDCRRP